MLCVCVCFSVSVSVRGAGECAQGIGGQSKSPAVWYAWHKMLAGTAGLVLLTLPRC